MSYWQNFRSQWQRVRYCLIFLATPEEIVPPTDEVLAQLHTLALQGRLMAIEQQLKTLEKVDEKYQPFIQEVRQYADNFQNEKIRTFIEQYLANAKS